MARLLRSYGVSKLHPPTVIGSPVTFGPVKVVLAADLKNRSFRLSVRAPHPKLRPPAVVGDPVVFAPVRVVLRKPPPPRQPFAQHSKLRPPEAIGAAVVFRPVKVGLAAPQQVVLLTRRLAHSKLRPVPVVDAAAPVVFAAQPPSLTLAGSVRNGRGTHYTLRRPAVVDAAAAPGGTLLTRTLLGVGI